ncbi:GNAT family N-acetyltransferase [Microbacterium sp. C7(2022)]|uniref:GNAT family N-acetyltransferase n=1 Tax=Microbacterium sp. C7(2022) TaxID=2992759 RepID=UPI00237B90D3|nr:GNAT family N-acetyltransferase [Microbacterium sp. C7(2022)]MDE0547155.1 GNAT family N-acetyltransferase [Microbacterium sp. C7(2022)]
MLLESPVNTAIAHDLLTEYFHSRELGFAQQNVTYTITFPDPASFVPPHGVFVVAYDGEGEPVGCGGIRLIDPGARGVRYELKHLYLRPATRGKGWGRAIVDELETRALGFGAREIVLDTHHSLTAAGALYASAGYTSIEAYNSNPNATRWYSKTLGD